MDRGQLTIEFILLVVVMLTLLATVSVPLVNSMADTAKDTSVATGLASAAQKLSNTAEEVSMAGCGSHKKITVYIEPEFFAEPILKWNDVEIWGTFSNVSGDLKTLKKISYSGVGFTGVCGEDGMHTVTVKKDCETEPLPGSIGFECS